MWVQRSASAPHAYACPATGEYALLLVVADAEIPAEEQARLAERFVRSGCRYAVCFGPTSSSWDDAIDMVNVIDDIEGRASPFVMTTWHDDEPLEETVAFFADDTRFDDWAPGEFVVLILGGTDALEREVRSLLARHFG